MLKYKVRSGQNIFDVALTLYGSVEGIFDLLASNDWLTINTALSFGMELNYHDEYIINKQITSWLDNNNVIVKNGDHVYYPLDINNTIKQHIQTHHPEQYAAANSMSFDEQTLFWSSLCLPRMAILQHGQISTIALCLKPCKHLVIDWGDNTSPQIIESTTEQEINHYYKGPESHIITFYGDFDFDLLNLKEVCGIHYPLNIIRADVFEASTEIDNLNKLIITR